MTWDMREAAALSAAIKSHRSVTATPAPKRIYHLKSGAFSSSLAELTDPRARNVARRWLGVAIPEAAEKAEKARHYRKGKEASICEARLTGLRNFALALGPMEPETLLLRPEQRVH